MVSKPVQTSHNKLTPRLLNAVTWGSLYRCAESKCFQRRCLAIKHRCAALRSLHTEWHLNVISCIYPRLFKSYFSNRWFSKNVTSYLKWTVPICNIILEWRRCEHNKSQRGAESHGYTPRSIKKPHIACAHTVRKWAHLPFKVAASPVAAIVQLVIRCLELHPEVKIRLPLQGTQETDRSRADPSGRQQDPDPVTQLQVHGGMGHKHPVRPFRGSPPSHIGRREGEVSNTTVIGFVFPTFIVKWNILY